MSTTIAVEIPTAIEGAAKRVLHLIETGYLPAPMKSDLETLMRAAMAWEVYSRAGEVPRTL